MKTSFRGVIVALVLCIYAQGQAQTTELRSFPTDTIDNIITRSEVGIDKNISSSGKGSIRITATEPRTVRLFETGPLDTDNARLIYKAKLRTENVKGQAYLEMWVSFPGKGEYFSRGLQNPLSGANEWTSTETPFFLKSGEKPDNVKLNVVVDGTGTVWVDDVKIMKGPLQ